MENASAYLSASAFGRSFTKDLSVTSETGQPFSPSLGKAFTGSLTTRTDNNTGIVTVDDADHTIQDGDLICLFWEGDTPGRRRRMTADVTGAAVTIDLGAGDNLPVADTEVIICTMEPVNINVVGDDVQAILLGANGAECLYSFMDNAGTPAECLYVDVEANDAYVWTSNLDVTNPIAGDTTTKVYCGHNNTSGAQICNGAVLFD